jgi:hypothetical protein
VNPFRWLWRVLFVDEEPRAPTPEEIVELGHVDGEGAAELWRDILEQRGIHSMAKNTSAIAYTRHGSPWMVYVQYKDVAEARELLGLDDGEE